jgi:hypothetical protein
MSTSRRGHIGWLCAGRARRSGKADGESRRRAEPGQNQRRRVMLNDDALMRDTTNDACERESLCHFQAIACSRFCEGPQSQRGGALEEQSEHTAMSDMEVIRHYARHAEGERRERLGRT